ncbi:MAG TPA: ATP-binding protein [Vicinamibacterales bacterium]|nr:ATP-binding protein [Vicinamibacterales bacterium]
MDRRASAFARLFEAVHEGVYIGAIGPGSSSTIAANPHLKLIFGYAGDASEKDVRPFDLDRFVDPHARTGLLERLTTDGSVNDYLLRLRRADGNAVWIELTARADPPKGDGMVRVEALMRDVSERKKLDDETRDLYHQLLQSEKMAALGQTISGVAHELNNPLATILSWAERLSDRSGLDAPLRRGLETILSESERAARIVRNLLTFARKRQTTRAMVDLNQVIRETLALRSYEQRVTNVAVIEALSAGLPQVFADGHQVQQVLLNLIINAEQAMLAAHGRGTIVVRTWQDRDRETVVLEINDDGPGIPSDLQPKIFDPFFTTKEVGKGTGLGLTVAYAIVQEHGGRIRLESRAGSGASFYVELPVTGKIGTLPQRRPSRETVDVVAGASILLVEDETKLASAVADALGDAGYIVEHAADGEQALAKIGEKAFDGVICDLKMPRLDGKAFYRRLSETAPTLSRKIVFVTGDVAGTDAERFLEESGCRWLAKPFRLGDLLKAVASTIGCLLCVLWGSGVIRDSGFVATRIPIHTCRISEPPRSVPVGGRRA